ncbi:hypothetical protein acdb102_04390 [Acidothermaceae bacterium B102]|nr:hypothetical protein acdb102_04390 [Acidothermaceae bacterium B102]
MLRCVRTTAVAVLTCGLAMGTAAAATPTTIVTIPGQLVVPAPPQAHRTNGLVASANGIAYAHWVDQAVEETAFVRSAGSTAHQTAGLSQTVSLVGDQLVGWAYRAPGTLPELTGVSLSTGVRQDLGVAESADAYDVTDDTVDSLPRGTGTGWIDARIGVAGTTDALVLTSTIGAPTREFPLPVAGVRAINQVTADSGGLAATILYGSDGQVGNGAAGYAGGGSYYLDFATGTWTLIGSSRTDIALSPGFIAYASGGTLFRFPRSAPGSAPESRSIPVTTRAIAITDTASAWIDSPSRYSYSTAPDTLTTAPEPSAVTGVTVAAAAPEYDGFSVAAVGGNDFATVTAGPGGFGVYRVTAGSAVLGDLMDLETGSAGPISESTGQQSSIAVDGSSATIAALTLKGGAIRLGRTRVVRSPAGAVINQVVTDGPRTAVVSTVAGQGGIGGKATLTITGATLKPWRIPVDGPFIALTMSGHRLLAFDEVRDDTAAFHGRTRLLDLNHYGSHWMTVPDISAISDHWLAYERNDGSVWLRDLAKPRLADRQVAPAGPPSDPRGDHGRINLSGDWITWPEWGLNDSRRISGAYQLSSHKLLTLPFSDPVQSNGLVAYADAGHGLHLYSLASGADQTVAGASVVNGLSLSDTAMSYVDLAGQAVVVPIASLVTAPPRAVPVLAPVTKAPFVATFETTRPLVSWTLQVRSAKGKVVVTSNGSAPTGWVRVAWGGRDSHGHRLATGAYRWTLTGKGPGGALTTSAGKGLVTGVVHL